MLIGSELWRQSLSLIFPPIQASNGAMPSTKHERRIVVIIRVRGCKMIKKSGMKALRDANTTRRAFESFTGTGVNVSLPYAGSVREVCRFR